MFGRKTARKRPKHDRIGITAIGLGLEQDPRMIEYGTRSIQSMIHAWVLLVFYNNTHIKSTQPQLRGRHTPRGAIARAASGSRFVF